MLSLLKDIWRVIKEQGLFLVFLAACFTHNMDNGSYVYFALEIILLVMVLFTNMKSYMDSTFFVLFIFALLYVVISPNRSFTIAIRLIIGLPVFYVYGKYVVSKCNYSGDHLIKMIVLTIIFYSFVMWWAAIREVLNGNIVAVGAADGYRQLITWGQSNMAPATTYGLICAMGLAGVVSFFVFNKRSYENSVALMLCFICSAVTTVYLLNRTGLVLVIFVLLVSVMYKSKGRIGRLVFFLGIAFLVYYMFSSGGILSDEVADAYSDRGSVTDGGDRIWRWVDALKRLFSQPFGWSDDPSVKYNFVHNMWLDIAMEAGIFSFVFFLIPTIHSIKDILLVYKKKDSDFCLVLLAVYSSVSLAYFVEPVFEANVFYVMLLMWIWGMANETVKGIKYGLLTN